MARAGEGGVRATLGDAPILGLQMSAHSNVRETANFRSETAVVNGVPLHYWIGGNPNGMPALLWHGFLGTGYSWHKVMPLLAEAGFSILVPDMLGYGDSDKPAGDEGYDSRALAEEFRALVRQIEFGAGQPLLLAAHDMGAPPALLWAADYPGEVAGPFTWKCRSCWPRCSQRSLLTPQRQ